MAYEHTHSHYSALLKRGLFSRVVQFVECAFSKRSVLGSNPTRIIKIFYNGCRYELVMRSVKIVEWPSIGTKCISCL